MIDISKSYGVCNVCGYSKTTVIRHDIIQLITLEDGEWIAMPTQEVKIYRCKICGNRNTVTKENIKK